MLKELTFQYLTQYGYVILFLSFLLQMLVLPLPSEAIMGYVGYLTIQGSLSLILSVLAISLGLYAGIIIAYYLGYKFGHPLFKKYGHYVHMGPQQMDSLAKWFEKYGNKVLIAGFFIPGVRHFIGYFAGIIEIPLRIFMIYGYVGAILYAGTYILLGRFLGADWQQYHSLIEKYVLVAAIIAMVILIIINVFRYKVHFQEFTARTLGYIVERYHYSLLYAKVMATSILVVFSSLVILMIDIIHNYLSKDLGSFNYNTTLLVKLVFDRGLLWLRWADFLTSINVMAFFVVLGLILILVRSKERLLDIIVLTIAIMGGQAIQELLPLALHRLGSAATTASLNFPSEQTFQILVIWGYILYLFLRFNAHVFPLLRGTSTVALFITVIAVGINHVIGGLEAPSDVIAGYVFGAVWLSFNLIMLEILRLHNLTLWFSPENPLQ